MIERILVTSSELLLARSTFMIFLLRLIYKPKIKSKAADTNLVGWRAARHVTLYISAFDAPSATAVLSCSCSEPDSVIRRFYSIK